METGWAVYNRIGDQDVKQALQKIRCVAVPGFERFDTILKVKWADGEESAEELLVPLGEIEHPLQKAQLNAKFLSLALPVYGEEKATRIMEFVDGIENLDILSLMDLLN